MKRFVCFLLTFLMIVSLVPATVLTASAASSLKTSDQAIELIKQFEGFSEKPYTHGSDSYIGYGTYIADPSKYVGGITKTEATALLKNYLYDVVDVKINDFAKKYNIAFTQYQHDALASLSYNTGYGWMSSTDSVCKAVVNGKRGNELLDAFASWTGTSPEYEFFNGLMNRRLAEANLFLNNIYNSTAPSGYTYVILDSNGGKGVNKQFAYIASTSPKLSVTPTKDSDLFLGWYLVDAEKGTQTPVTALDKTYAKKTLTAKWQSGTTEVATKYTINSSASASRDVYYNTDSMAAANKKGTLKANSSFAVTLEKLVGNIKWIYGKGVNTSGKTLEGWVPYVNVKEENLSSEKVLATGTVTATTLAVYEAATASNPDGTSATPIGTLKKDDVLKIYAYKSEYTASGTKSWGKVAYNGGYGWVNLAYVDLRDATAEDNATLIGKTATVVNAAKVNVRVDAGTDKALANPSQIAKDTKVTIYETKQLVGGTTWARIKWNNNLHEGWIYMYYLKVDGQGSGSISSPGSSSPDVVLYTGIVNSNINLNVRTGPSVGSTQVGSLPRGTSVNVYEKTTTNGVEWGRIDNNRWVCLLYVNLTATGNKPNTGNSGAEHVLVKKIGTINASALILRKEATNNSEMLDTLSKDAKVTIVEEKTETTTTGTKKWGKVTYNGKEGWINLAYVDIQEVTETIPETPTNPETGVYGRVVNCIKVNVRSDAGVGNTLVTQLDNGTMVTVYEQITKDNAPWGRIKEGWVCMNYVELTGNVPSGSGSGSSSNTGTTTITGTVNSNIDLNVRSGAGLGNGKIGSLKKGTKVTVTEQKVADGMSWGKIKYNNIDGWICMSYITIDSMTSSGNGTSVMGTIARCFSAVNVRSAAGVGNALVGTIPVGTRVQVFEKTMVNGEYWARVSNGWICMQYVILDEELPDAPAATEPSTDNGAVDSEKVNPNSAVDYSFSATVKAASAKVYTDAIDTGYEAGSLNQGTAVTILALKAGKDDPTETWGRVNEYGIPGWVNLKDMNVKITGYVQVNTLTVYAAASASSEDLGVVTLNDPIEVYELRVNGSTVYGKINKGTGEITGWIDMSKVAAGTVISAYDKTDDTSTIISGRTFTGVTVYTDVNANEVAFKLNSGASVKIQKLDANHGIIWGKVSVGETTGWLDMSKTVFSFNKNVTFDVDIWTAPEGNANAEKLKTRSGNFNIVSIIASDNGEIWGQVDGNPGGWVRLSNIGDPEPAPAPTPDPAPVTPGEGTPGEGTPGEGTPGEGTPGEGTPGD